MDRIPTKETENSMLFLEYLKNNGFKPNNYKGILELGQSVPNSLSQFLVMYRQYLLSDKVNYAQLHKYAMDGAYGYIERGQIVIPKSIENDQHFFFHAPLEPLVPYYMRNDSKHPSIDKYPSIDEFGVVISEGIWPYINETKSLTQDRFFGFCIDHKDARCINFTELKRFLEDRFGYKCDKDEDTNLRKVYFLAKNTK